MLNMIWTLDAAGRLTVTWKNAPVVCARKPLAGKLFRRAIAGRELVFRAREIER